MKTIVYFLGAGFSMPAGLPVISNFLFKAKLQLHENKGKYSYFREVFEYIDSLSKAKNYTNIDLFNIEEVFSIADTHELLGKKRRELLERFIKDVIEYHAPEFETPQSRIMTAQYAIKSLFPGGVKCPYISFVASLLNASFSSSVMNKDFSLSCDDFKVSAQPSGYNYKVITLNYDTIIEDAIEYLEMNFSGELTIPLAKLHGSVNGTIVPPTWNKELNPEIEDAWASAAAWLSEASEIRILGYSMPQTDIYIKHLFSTAMIESEGLQSIEVLCLDPDKKVSQRYDQLFTFPRYRFKEVDIADYLSCFVGSNYVFGPFRVYALPLETAHKKAMELPNQRKN